MTKLLKSTWVLFILAGMLAVASRMPPVYAAAVASIGFLMFGLVALRPVVRSWGQGRGPIDGTLIVGSDERARRLYEEFAGKESDIHLVHVRELEQLSAKDHVSSIVVANPDLKAADGFADALIDFKLRGVRVETAVDTFERRSRKIWLDGLSPEWLIFARGFRPSRFYLGVKRLGDILCSVILLVLMAPVAALAAIAIKLESEGPVIFKQERVGLGRRNFTLYKFRSMRQDAEKDGPKWAEENDNRVTRVGALMRRSRLDELPQVFNVLRGDMSFVGPRPERPYFVELLKTKIRFYDLRHYVKPGITGWAQVMYPYGASVEDSYQKLQYDLYYAKNVSFRLDALALAKTIGVVVSGEGR